MKMGLCCNENTDLGESEKRVEKDNTCPSATDWLRRERICAKIV